MGELINQHPVAFVALLLFCAGFGLCPADGGNAPKLWQRGAWGAFVCVLAWMGLSLIVEGTLFILRIGGV